MLDYIPYTILLAFVLIVLYSDIKRTSKYNIVMWILIVFSGLRYNVGYDYPGYFNAVLFPLSSDVGRFELIPQKLVYFCHYLDSRMLFFFITSLITNGLIIKGIVNRSTDPRFSIFAYICLPFLFIEFLCIVRQALAVALVFYGARYLYIDKKHNLYFLVFLFLAVNCHITALLGILLLLPIHRVDWKAQVIMLISCFVVGNSLYIMLGNVDLTVLPIGGYYLKYLQNENVEEGGKMVILYGIFAVLNCFALKLYSKQSTKEYRYLSIANLGFCIIFLFVFNHMMCLRISRYFTVFLVLTAPLYVNLFNKKRRNLRIFSITLVLLFYVQLYIAQMSFLQNKHSKSYMPYQCILFEDDTKRLLH